MTPSHILLIINLLLFSYCVIFQEAQKEDHDYIIRWFLVFDLSVLISSSISVVHTQRALSVGG